MNKDQAKRLITIQDEDLSKLINSNVVFGFCCWVRGIYRFGKRKKESATEKYCENEREKNIVSEGLEINIFFPYLIVLN